MSIVELQGVIYDMNLIAEAVQSGDIQDVKNYQAMGIHVYPKLMDIAVHGSNSKMIEYLKTQGLVVTAEHTRILLMNGNLELVKTLSMTEIKKISKYKIEKDFPVNTIMYLFSKEYPFDLAAITCVYERSKKHIEKLQLEKILIKFSYHAKIKEYTYEFRYWIRLLKCHSDVYFIQEIRELLHKIYDVVTKKISLRKPPRPTWTRDEDAEFVKEIEVQKQIVVELQEVSTDVLCKWLPCDICKFVIPSYF
jgi:hypothetical protein